MTDTELRILGTRALAHALGEIEAERFISLIQRERFDYTKWRQGQWDDSSIAEISRRAMEWRKKTGEPSCPADPPADDGP